MRWLTVVLLCACGASVDSENPAVNDGPEPMVDAAVDAPIDARPCSGGDQSMVAPDGSCFVFFGQTTTYAAAKLACESIDAHLAVLTTAALDTAAEAFVGTNDTWIGLDDLATEATFVWVDGTPLAFANFHAGEPNDSGGEDCAVIAGLRTGKQWDDRPCVPNANGLGGDYARLCQF
ncbi:MAG: C-type lectin domain-containing protein [Kofleriaceae bacterium]